MKGRFDLHIHSDTGILWHITSPHVPGLLANGYTIPDVLEAAAKAIRDMALATAVEIYEGRPVKPIFKPAASFDPVSDSNGVRNDG